MSDIQFPDRRIVLAGFGGQGVLFAGKVIAYTGLLSGREVSWLPSYGPEMRGGTANCSVTLAKEPIGSPLITVPQVLIAMNQPSFDKFAPVVEQGGLMVTDATLVVNACDVPGVKLVSLPATQIAEDEGLKGLGNIVMLGAYFALDPFCVQDTLMAAIDKCVPPKKAALVEKNKQALRLGMQAIAAKGN